MANRTQQIIPPNGFNLIQEGQILLGSVIQPGGVIQYTGTANQFKQNLQVGGFEKFIKAETKSLSAIQIIIGLIHIGFGGVMIIFRGFDTRYFPMTTFGGYPFWGGIFFIASGSFSVALEKLQFTRMVKCGMGMNIAGAVIALIGTILYAVEWRLNSLSATQDADVSWPVGTGLAFLLLVFSFLEFCIAASMAHYLCLAICCNKDMTIVCVPYTVSGDGGVSSAKDVLPEDKPAPPIYGSVAVFP